MVSPASPPTHRRSLASSALTTFSTQVVAAGLSLINVLIIARALGPVGRGEVAYLSTIAFLTAQLCSLGIQQANANLAAAEPRLRPALATNTLVLALGLGGIAMTGLWGLIAAFPGLGGETSAGVRWLALGSIPIHIAVAAFLTLVQADYAFRAANIAWLASPVVTVVVNGSLAAAGHLSVPVALGAWIGGQALGGIILLTYVVRRLAGLGAPDPAVARRSLAFGIKAHAGRTMMLGNYRLDQWFVGAIAGSRELGLYSVAVAWSEALFYLPTALAAVQRPDLVRASRVDAARLAATLFRVAALATAPLALLLVLLAPVLCVDVFGPEFRGSVDDLRMLALGAFGIAALKLLGNSLTAQRKPMLETAAIAVAFTVGLVLDLILIPPHGGLGAATASAVAYTAGGVAAVVIFARALGARLSSLVPREHDLAWFVRFVQTRMRRAVPGPAE
jgi:O-antigen/teichoic acid export membrane protein